MNRKCYGLHQRSLASSGYMDIRFLELAMRRFIALCMLLPFVSNAAVIANETRFTPDVMQRAVDLQDEELIYLGDTIFRASEVRSGVVLTKLWPNGRVPLSFSQNVSASQKNAFHQACAAWGVGTSLRCVDRTSEANHVLVETHFGERCNGPHVSCSSVGMVGGPQTIRLHHSLEHARRPAA